MSLDRVESWCKFGGKMRILVTGGTGFLGRHIVRHYLGQGMEVVSFSRDEGKHEVQKRESEGVAGRLVSWIGDVRDPDTVARAMVGCEAVVHAAAQKHVPWGEEFPEECIRTNVQGTISVQRAADAEDVPLRKRVLISTDKACKPINTYGASKFLAEQVWGGQTIRFGNIWGSTGSVVYWLLAQRGRPEVRITSKQMVRYHLRVEDAVAYIDHELHSAGIGCSTPVMRWYNLKDLAEAVCPGQAIVETGVRVGEKLVEDLDTHYAKWMTVEELRREVETLCGSTGTVGTPR